MKYALLFSSGVAVGVLGCMYANRLVERLFGDKRIWRTEPLCGETNCGLGVKDGELDCWCYHEHEDG